MAGTFVSKEQFEEFTKCMELSFHNVGERFEDVNKRFDDFARQINRRLGDFKANIDQRFQGIDQQMSDFRAEMRQMRNWLVRLFGLVVFCFIGGILMIMLREFIFP